MARVLAQLLLAASLATAAPDAATKSIFTRTSIEMVMECQTHSAQATASASSLPTNNLTRHHTRETTMTVTAPGTVLQTGTSTTYTPTVASFIPVTSSSSLDRQTSVEFEYTTLTVGTLTETITGCANGLRPSYTQTVYAESRSASGGEASTRQRLLAAYVNCTMDRTSHLTIFPTITSGRSTITSTSAVPAPTVTQNSTRTVVIVDLPITNTVTSSWTSYVAIKTWTTRVQKSCPAKVTTTYAAKCSAPKMFDETNGHSGVATVTGAPGSAWVYASNSSSSGGGSGGAGYDASACCQLCQKSIGCAAFHASPTAGSCALYYIGAKAIPSSAPVSAPVSNWTIGDGRCGLAFVFEGGDRTGLNEANDAAEPGDIVGVGCGSIGMIR